MNQLVNTLHNNSEWSKGSIHQTGLLYTVKVPTLKYTVYSILESLYLRLSCSALTLPFHFLCPESLITHHRSGSGVVLDGSNPSQRQTENSQMHWPSFNFKLSINQIFVQIVTRKHSTQSLEFKSFRKKKKAGPSTLSRFLSIFFFSKFDNMLSSKFKSL